MRKIKSIFLIPLFLSILFSIMALSAEKPQIGILQFTNNVSDVEWWSDASPVDLQDALLTALNDNPTIENYTFTKIDHAIHEDDLLKGPHAKAFETLKAKSYREERAMIVCNITNYDAKPSVLNFSFTLIDPSEFTILKRMDIQLDLPEGTKLFGEDCSKANYITNMVSAVSELIAEF